MIDLQQSYSTLSINHIDLDTPNSTQLFLSLFTSPITTTPVGLIMKFLFIPNFGFFSHFSPILTRDQ